jgi:hypothetical protein
MSKEVEVRDLQRCCTKVLEGKTMRRWATDRDLHLGAQVVAGVCDNSNGRKLLSGC